MARRQGEIDYTIREGFALRRNGMLKRSTYRSLIAGVMSDALCDRV